MNNIKIVLLKLSEFGLKVNIDKCEFMKDRITYCGHEIDKDELWKQNSKIESVLNTPRPMDVSYLSANLGILNFYTMFFTKSRDRRKTNE